MSHLRLANLCVDCHAQNADRVQTEQRIDQIERVMKKEELLERARVSGRVLASKLAAAGVRTTRHTYISEPRRLFGRKAAVAGWVSPWPLDTHPDWNQQPAIVVLSEDGTWLVVDGYHEPVEVNADNVGTFWPIHHDGEALMLGHYGVS